ncbi:hypothetical protein C8R41DRAFT_818661 [Lentinula lateritia]|uniref:Hyaluronan-mediated motility receptor C-terminal domain-containing protein n=1 Tax=Lentinula lateritia TaxID=40482 RepID=A0ABQ8VPH1_9AGAR|nr:hypothetical protein C8R41DRAFT_818661 [Lentinula lateritia]
MSEITGHRAHSAESKKSAPNPRINGPKRPSPPSDASERYTVLQRKVDDLEKVHNDGKKAHQTEVERLKLELARLQKGNAELTDRLDKQKKQKEALDLRVDELKRNSSADKAEIKDLGVKLRMSEHQRTQMTAKHGNVADVKKSLQSLETRRKEELKERDRTVADLEKSLLTDKKKREMVESQLKETKAKHDVEIDKMKDTVEKLKREIVAARDEVQQIQHRLEATIAKTNSNEESLLAQLEDHKLMLNEVAEHYGLLASNTVPRPAFERLTFENYALRIQAARSSRKLGNTEGQVSELANLIRQSQEENQILRRNSKDMMQELSSFIENATSKPPSPPSYDDLDEIITHLDRDLETLQEEEARVNIEALQLEAELHHLQHDALFFAYAEAETELHEALAIASKLPEVEQQRDIAQELLQATNITAESLRLSSDKFKLQVAELEEKLKTETRKSDEALQKEKGNAHRLTTTVQKLRMAEDGLRAENEQLTYELSEAERFQEAYYSLSEELEGLLDRNALAEDEAQRLSRVNAEIIGHHNPLQRIMYLEKIRNELAETKQKLLVSMRTNETVAIQNQDLQNELDMYKSVAVPHELKLGTKFTRMARPPLMNLNKSTPHSLEVTQTLPSKVHNSITSDMNVDEWS